MTSQLDVFSQRRSGVPISLRAFLSLAALSLGVCLTTIFLPAEACDRFLFASHEASGWLLAVAATAGLFGVMLYLLSAGRRFIAIAAHLIILGSLGLALAIAAPFLEDWFVREGLLLSCVGLVVLGIIGYFFPRAYLVPVHASLAGSGAVILVVIFGLQMECSFSALAFGTAFVAVAASRLCRGFRAPKTLEQAVDIGMSPYLDLIRLAEYAGSAVLKKTYGGNHTRGHA